MKTLKVSSYGALSRKVFLRTIFFARSVKPLIVVKFITMLGAKYKLRKLFASSMAVWFCMARNHLSRYRRTSWHNAPCVCVIFNMTTLYVPFDEKNLVALNLIGCHKHPLSLLGLLSNHFIMELDFFVTKTSCRSFQKNSSVQWRCLSAYFQVKNPKNCKVHCLD